MLARCSRRVLHKVGSSGNAAEETWSITWAASASASTATNPAAAAAGGAQQLLVVHPRAAGEEQLHEAVSLASTYAGKNCPHVVIGPRHPRVSSSTYLGEGSVDAVARQCDLIGAERVFVNAGLSGVQQRNLQRSWSNRPVLDRVGLIIGIFAQRARTSEARLQVELASIDYQASRLVRTPDAAAGGRGGFGEGSEVQVVSARERGRSGGTSGGLGGGGGGGEAELKLQRRRLADKRKALLKRLEEVRRTRAVQRAGRQRSGMPLVALVGYTNAGKSSLLRALTGAEAGVGNRPFETLDPQLKRMHLPPPMPPPPPPLPLAPTPSSLGQWPGEEEEETPPGTARRRGRPRRGAVAASGAAKQQQQEQREGSSPSSTSSSASSTSSCPSSLASAPASQGSDLEGDDRGQGHSSAVLYGGHSVGSWDGSQCYSDAHGGYHRQYYRHALLADTVGFISDLPHQLVDAFRATLEEVTHADLLLHVLDGSSPLVNQQREAVLQVLRGLGLSDEMLRERVVEVWNKSDLVMSSATAAVAAPPDTAAAAAAVHGLPLLQPPSDTAASTTATTAAAVTAAVGATPDEAVARGGAYAASRVCDETSGRGTGTDDDGGNPVRLWVSAAQRRGLGELRHLIGAKLGQLKHQDEQQQHRRQQQQHRRQQR